MHPPLHPPRRPRAAAAALLAVLLACSGDVDGIRAASASPSRRPGPPPVVRTPDVPYRAIAVANDGSIRGTVEADSIPRDTVVTPARDQAVCGTSFVDRTVTATGTRLGGAVVWLEDIRTGKALPLARRFQAATERCVVQPRVQAAVVGGTLNVATDDALTNQLLVSRDGELLSIVRLTDFGQVVPVEQALRRPGLVTLTSAVHPWTRGYVLVFDHPYFAVTPTRGDFRLD
ncbi:MAG TPA: hypothetical protein VFY16_12015, partial [Gemmatimonadaceae bacterium]|nr:hypothetical protein [Gemmatimonadaceae bacterium]